MFYFYAMFTVLPRYYIEQVSCMGKREQVYIKATQGGKEVEGGSKGSGTGHSGLAPTETCTSHIYCPVF